MLSYNPEKTIGVPEADLVKNFFNEDIFAPGAFLNFKKDLFDYFANNPSAKKQFRTHWILNVYATWNFLNQLDSDDFLNYGVEQIPEATRLGFDVAEKLTWYMAVNLRNPKLMTLFYSQLRNAFYSSNASLSLTGEELKISNLVEQVRLLNSYSGDTIKAAELYDKLQHVVFAGAESSIISDYVMVDKKDAIMNLVNLTNFFLQIEPENIWEAVSSYTFSEEAGVPAESVAAPVAEPILDPEDAPELSEKEKAMLVDKKTEPQKEAVQAVESVSEEARQKPESNWRTNKPTYQEIKDKVDSAFPKDKSGVYKDLDGVLMALQKAADKYSDPKIAELYFFDEQEEKFKWNI